MDLVWDVKKKFNETLWFVVPSSWKNEGHQVRWGEEQIVEE